LEISPWTYTKRLNTAKIEDPFFEKFDLKLCGNSFLQNFKIKMADFVMTRKKFFILKLKDNIKFYQCAKFQLNRMKIGQVMKDFAFWSVNYWSVN